MSAKSSVLSAKLSTRSRKCAAQNEPNAAMSADSASDTISRNAMPRIMPKAAMRFLRMPFRPSFAPGARQIRSSEFCSSPNTVEAPKKSVAAPTSSAKTLVPGLAALASSASLARARALRADEAGERLEQLAAHRRVAEHEAGERDHDEEQRRERKERVVRERRAHARRGVVDPGGVGEPRQPPGVAGCHGTGSVAPIRRAGDAPPGV